MEHGYRWRWVCGRYELYRTKLLLETDMSIHIRESISYKRLYAVPALLQLKISIVTMMRFPPKKQFALTVRCTSKCGFIIRVMKRLIAQTTGYPERLIEDYRC